MTEKNYEMPVIEIIFFIFSPGPYKFTDTLMERLRMFKDEKNSGKPIIGLDPNHLKTENPNFVVYQVIGANL